MNGTERDVGPAWSQACNWCLAAGVVGAMLLTAHLLWSSFPRPRHPGLPLVLAFMLATSISLGKGKKPRPTVHRVIIFALVYLTAQIAMQIASRFGFELTG